MSSAIETSKSSHEKIKSKFQTFIDVMKTKSFWSSHVSVGEEVVGEFWSRRDRRISIPVQMAAKSL